MGKASKYGSLSRTISRATDAGKCGRAPRRATVLIAVSGVARHLLFGSRRSRAMLLPRPSRDRRDRALWLRGTRRSRTGSRNGCPASRRTGRAAGPCRMRQASRGCRVEKAPATHARRRHPTVVQSTSSEIQTRPIRPSRTRRERRPMSDPASARAARKRHSAPLSDLAILIVEAGLLSAFLGALVFVAGWSYAERFFAELGLGLSAIDGLEATSFSAFALWVFRDGWMAVLVFLVAAAFVLALAWRSDGPRPIAGSRLRWRGGARRAGAHRRWISGSLRAQRQVPLLLAESYHVFPRVVVVAKPDSALAAFLADRGDLGATSCLRKVFMDRAISTPMPATRACGPPAEHLHPAALGDRGDRGRAATPASARRDPIILRRGRRAPRRRGRVRRGCVLLMRSSLVWRRARAGSLIGWASQIS